MGELKVMPMPLMTHFTEFVGDVSPCCDGVDPARWRHRYGADSPLSARENADVFAHTFLYGALRREEVRR